jgi:hypothetical protein
MSLALRRAVMRVVVRYRPGAHMFFWEDFVQQDAGVAASAREMVMANGDGMGWGEPRRRSIE